MKVAGVAGVEVAAVAGVEVVVVVVVGGGVVVGDVVGSAFVVARVVDILDDGQGDQNSREPGHLPCNKRRKQMMSTVYLHLIHLESRCCKEKPRHYHPHFPLRQ